MHTDDLGNVINGIQTGPNSVESMTDSLQNLIDTEVQSLPEGKRSYGNIDVAGFSQGASAVVALLVKYDRPEPIRSMIAYAGYMPVDHKNWADNVKVQQTIPFLQLAGNHD